MVQRATSEGGHSALVLMKQNDNIN